MRYLVSPNKIHYAHIDNWAKIYPQAIAWASPGVREGAAQKNITVNFDRNLTATAPFEWATQIEQLIFKGSRFMEEVVFFHCQSENLILADLIENFEPHKLNNIWFRSFTHLAGSLDSDDKAP